MRTAVRDARSSAVPSLLRPSRILPPFHPPLLGPVLLLLRPSASPSFPSPSLPTFIPSHFHPSPSPPLSRIHPFPFPPPSSRLHLSPVPSFPASILIPPHNPQPHTPSRPGQRGQRGWGEPPPRPIHSPHTPKTPPHTQPPDLSVLPPSSMHLFPRVTHGWRGSSGDPPPHLLGIPLLETLFLQHGAAPGAPTFF